MNSRSESRLKFVHDNNYHHDGMTCNLEVLSKSNVLTLKYGKLVVERREVEEEEVTVTVESKTKDDDIQTDKM